jgi:hypothetical protein
MPDPFPYSQFPDRGRASARISAASTERKQHALVCRYEFKYFVPHELLHVLRREIQPFVEPDPYAAQSPNGRYRTNSLYLDSLDLRLFRMTMHGEKTRFKLRIRSYSDSCDQPVFFEIKRRADGIVRKSRCPARRSQAERFLTGEQRAANPRDPQPDIAEFAHLARAIDAGPTFRVRYDREAYEARGGEPTRITFDTDLAYNFTTGADLSSGGLGWRQILTDKAIVEIKFTDRFPTWVRSIVQRYNLQRCSVPKYCLSVEHAVDHGECLIPVLGHRPLAFAL